MGIVAESDLPALGKGVFSIQGGKKRKLKERDVLSEETSWQESRDKGRGRKREFRGMKTLAGINESTVNYSRQLKHEYSSTITVNQNQQTHFSGIVLNVISSSCVY